MTKFPAHAAHNSTVDSAERALRIHKQRMRLFWRNPQGSDIGRAILEFDQRQALQRCLADAQMTSSLSKTPVFLIESI